MGKASRKCGAKLKGDREGRCSRPAGWGTDHPGSGQCKFHGGSSGVGCRIAAPATLEQLVGYKVDIGPLDALLMCVRIAAAEVAYFGTKLAELPEAEAVGRVRQEKTASLGSDSGYDIVDLEGPVELNIWFKARQDAVHRLAQYSAMALKAGVEERMIGLAEGMGERLATALESIFNELELTPDQLKKAPQAVRAQLVLLEGGAA